MKPERWQQISRIFNRAISLDAAARAAYVKEKCGTDSDLRAEVERLIESHNQAEEGDFIGGLAVEDVAEHFTEGEATLALHKAEAAGTGATTEHLTAGQCRPGLNVPDLDVFHQRMEAHDVRCLQPPKNVFGSRVAQYLDPDGLSVSVGEAR